MAITINRGRVRPRPQPEDYLRALSYGVLAAWGVVYLFFPPASTLEALDTTLRYIWMTVTILGSVLAIVGALRRVDLKMELPGVAFAMLGPVFYFLTQVTFVIAPTESSGPPETRFALMVYALLPVLFVLPRIVSLLTEARRLKKINTESVETAHAIMQTLSTGSTPTAGGDKK